MYLGIQSFKKYQHGLTVRATTTSIQKETDLSPLAASDQATTAARRTRGPPVSQVVSMGEVPNALPNSRSRCERPATP